MNSFLRWVFDVDHLPADATNVHLGWQHGLPAWMLLLALFACGLFAVWSYSGLVGPRRARGLLAASRFGLLLGLVLLLAGPMLVVPEELVERDWVVMLVDRTESMQIADVELPSGARKTRDAQVRTILSDHEDTIREIADAHNILWLGFDGGAHDLALDENGLPLLAEPDGRQTAISTALQQAMRRVAARPVSGVVLLTDGQTSRPPDRSILRRLNAEGVPVISVPLGSADPLGDLAVRHVESPVRAFVHDKVPVRVHLDRFGFDPDRGAGRVQLVDDATGVVLDERVIDPAANEEPITLVAVPEVAGEVNWSVRIEPDTPDLIDTNNAQRIMVELVDRPLKVLYVDGYPRWDYRFIKTLLVRERTIDSSVMLLSADRDFAQEGNTPITRMPNSPEEFEPYDVIVIGDVHGEFFSPRQLEMIRDHVAERGAGVLWIAGERANPETYANTILAGLIPIRGSLNLPAITDSFTMQSTPLAESLGVLQIISYGTSAWPVLSDPIWGWTTLRWALRIHPRDLKPTAEILAQSAEPMIDGLRAPLVVHMRFGAGQSIFVATDEMWRWRYAHGETLTQQFWIQMIRMLGRDRLAMSGQPVSLSVEPRRVEVGQSVVIEVRLFDAELAERPPSELLVEIVNHGDGSVTEIPLTAVTDSPGRYAAAYVPDQSGELEVRVVEPSIARFNPNPASLKVYRPDDEMRHPQTDHGLLAQIADQTRGRVIEPVAFNELPGSLKNRTERTIMDIREPIWDTPFVFGLLAILLTLEWIGRKLIRLV